MDPPDHRHGPSRPSSWTLQTVVMFPEAAASLTSSERSPGASSRCLQKLTGPDESRKLVQDPERQKQQTFSADSRSPIKNQQKNLRNPSRTLLVPRNASKVDPDPDSQVPRNHPDPDSQVWTRQTEHKHSRPGNGSKTARGLFTRQTTVNML
ncbi:uncharacterized protein V6R79_011490 [Siganus canaliculatus]